MDNKRKQQLVAAAIAGMMGASLTLSTNAIAGSGAKAEKVKCIGVNSCKGTGECGQKENGHACHGKNACKGKGWVKKTLKECKAAGGKVYAPPKG